MSKKRFNVNGTATAPSSPSPSPNGTNGHATHACEDTTQHTTAEAPHDRDASGRFLKGCKGGPGNQHARRTAALRRVLLATVTDDDMRAVAQELLQQAKVGVLEAVKLFFLYVLGKPLPGTHHDGVALHEWLLTISSPSRFAVL